MAYYCEVTNLTRPSTHVIMVHFDMRDDAVEPHAEIMAGTVGFNVIIVDTNGDEIVETGAEKRARLRAEYDGYCSRLIRASEMIDSHFDALRTQAIGYIYRES